MKSCPTCSKEYDSSWSVCLDDRSKLVATAPSTETGLDECPYCHERIQPSAIKCRFCGEFLNKTADIKTSDRGTDSARAVSMGLKQKERDDAVRSTIMLISFITASLFGYGFKNWWIFFGVLTVGALFANYIYYQE